MDNPEIQFMGKITASVTHEMQNVFAIIKETAGLMDDLIAISKDGQFQHQERFQRAIANIGKQVERGVRLAGELNNFAHSADDARSVDLNEVVSNLVSLSQRFARTKRVVLSHSASAASPATTVNSLKLRMALFDCLDYLVDLAKPGTAIMMTAVPREADRIAIDFHVEGPDLNAEEVLSAIRSEPRWNALQVKAHSLEADMEIKEPPVWFSFVMRPAARHGLIGD
jgi:C4-dicarboxylate-specific signal transduction histidine kinase